MNKIKEEIEKPKHRLLIIENSLTNFLEKAGSKDFGICVRCKKNHSCWTAYNSS